MTATLDTTTPDLCRCPQFDLIQHPIKETVNLVANLLTAVVTLNDQRYRPGMDPITLFHSRAVPRISIHAYLGRILQYIPFTNEVLLNVLVFLDRIGCFDGVDLGMFHESRQHVVFDACFSLSAPEDECDETACDRCTFCSLPTTLFPTQKSQLGCQSSDDSSMTDAPGSRRSTTPVSTTTMPASPTPSTSTSSGSVSKLTNARLWSDGNGFETENDSTVHDNSFRPTARKRAKANDTTSFSIAASASSSASSGSLSNGTIPPSLPHQVPYSHPYSAAQTAAAAAAAAAVAAAVARRRDFVHHPSPSPSPSPSQSPAPAPAVWHSPATGAMTSVSSPSMGYGGHPLNPPSSGFRINSFSIHRLLITSLMIATKFTSDLFYSNARYAKVGGLCLPELNQLELEFLFTARFELNVKEAELQRVGSSLLRFEQHRQERLLQHTRLAQQAYELDQRLQRGLDEMQDPPISNKSGLASATVTVGAALQPYIPMMAPSTLTAVVASASASSASVGTETLKPTAPITTTATTAATTFTTVATSEQDQRTVSSPLRAPDSEQSRQCQQQQQRCQLIIQHASTTLTAGGDNHLRHVSGESEWALGGRNSAKSIETLATVPSSDLLSTASATASSALPSNRTALAEETILSPVSPQPHELVKGPGEYLEKHLAHQPQQEGQESLGCLSG